MKIAIVAPPSEDTPANLTVPTILNRCTGPRAITPICWPIEKCSLLAVEASIATSLRVVGHVVEREAEARRVLLRDAGYIIEDKLWRAYGTLRYARSLTFDEAMNYLSGVRLAGNARRTTTAAAVAASAAMPMTNPQAIVLASIG